MATLKLFWPARLNAAQPEKAVSASGTVGLPLIQESAFAQMLRFERRRSERSGRQFMLVLLSSDEFSSNTGTLTATTIAGAVSTKTRETDMLGWYEHDRTLGLLMTEIGQGDAATTERIVQKISGVVRGAITRESFHRLTMSFHLFPQATKGNAHRQEPYTFFPDLAKHHLPKKQTLKRSVDVAVSLLAVLVFLPVILVIALLIKLTSTGPVLFCQSRVGHLGKEFCFLKFRTMTVDNDPTVHREYTARLIDGVGEFSSVGTPFYKLTNDPRITPIGRLLRRTSLDELPQFLNILRGDMSLVGPRPPLPYEYERYQAWHKRRVHELKPGLTGLWQVEGRSRTNFNEMVRMDLRYAAKRSFWMDCRIMLQTPAAMISGRGAC